VAAGGREASSVSPGLAEALGCPRCGGNLVAQGSELSEFDCGSCSARYPVFGGLPCLVPDPLFWRALWLRRLGSYATGVGLRVSGLRDEAQSGDVLPRTSRRLRRLADGLLLSAERMNELFAPMRGESDELVPPRPEPGEQTAILECYENLFRDWSWGGGECAKTMELVAPLLPERPARVAVYGAGTGRLAIDIHAACSPDRTFALDVNPLPFLVTARLLAGEAIALPELPVDPVSDEVVVVDRVLSGPASRRDGLALIYADALRAPFAPASLDVVVTSWFIDVAGADVRTIAAGINRVLRPGGVWVNIGPLRFQAVQSRAYTIEEVLDVVSATAFELTCHDRHYLPYFNSPVSGNWRSDLTFRFAARKTGDASSVEVREAIPPWVANPFLPVPMTPAMAVLGRTSVFTANVLSMIDGERSIVEMAREMGSAWNVPPGPLQDQLRVFFAQLPSG
jgi:SAM-dependent methyltransferase/uncharacterized protein YbaR (Trm112 family)